MSKKADQITALEDCCVIEAFIECNECPQKHWLDENYPENDAYNKGWRVVNDNAICPTCIRLSKSEPQPKKKTMGKVASAKRYKKTINSSRKKK